jgi:cell filamentation protein, protein adenylyltransferase
VKLDGARSGLDDDPYLWPGTDCLRNLLGIRDREEFHTAEHEVVRARRLQLDQEFLPGDYDTAHLRAFHQFLFQDVYDWAGRFREGDISKDGQPFCPAGELADRLDRLFARVAARRLFVGMDWEQFIGSFAVLYGDLNAIHPFREGNGRTQRAFLRQLAANAGWTVDWSSLGRFANARACERYMKKGKPHALVRVLAPIVKPRAADG